jgi:hypothetical protein
MRIESTDTSIHDLTATEATDLRALCERMLRGPVDYSHPLLVAWCEGCGFEERQRTLAISTAFLPRALHALLIRERAACLAEIDREIATAKASTLLNFETRNGALTFLGYARKHIQEM